MLKMVSAAFDVSGNRIAQIVFNCLFSVGIIVSNFLVIGAVLSKKELRQNSKYVLVALLAFTDLYIGLFALPVNTNNLVTQTSSFTCTEFLVLQGGSYIKLAMSCLAVVAIDIDTILQISSKMYKGRCRAVTTFILALCFLVTPFIVLIPIFVNGKSPIFIGTCHLDLKPPYARATNALSYWVPAVCIVVATIVVVVVHQRAKRLQGYIDLQQQLQQEQQQQISPLPGGKNLADLVIVAAITVALNLPFYALSLSSCTGTCEWYIYLFLIFSYLSDARAFIVPLAWFANKDFLNTVLGRRTPESQPLIGQPPPYSNQQQHMASPVQGQTDQNNDSFPGKE